MAVAAMLLLCTGLAATAAPPKHAAAHRPKPGGILSRLWKFGTSQAQTAKAEGDEQLAAQAEPARNSTQAQFPPADPRDLFSQLWQPPGTQAQPVSAASAAPPTLAPAATIAHRPAPLLQQPGFFAPNGEPVAGLESEKPPAADVAMPSPPATPAPPRSDAASINRGTLSQMQNDAAGLLKQFASTAGATAAESTPAGESLRVESILPGGSVPVPSAAPLAALKQVQTATSDLWRPMNMSQNAAQFATPGQTSVARQDSPQATPGHSPISQPTPRSDDMAGSNVGSILLQPFTLSNTTPADHAGSGNGVAADEKANDLAGAIRSSSLIQQLALFPTNETESGTRAAALRAEHAAWDAGWAADASSGRSDGSSAELAAFLDDVAAEPDDLNVDTAEQLPPSPTPAGQQPTANQNKEDSLAEAEQLGEEPEDNSLQFLRTQTVLLKPGESQFDIGIYYLLTENEFPVLLVDDMDNIIGVDEVRFRVRELTVPLEYRFGLHKRVQAFVGAPIGWSNTQLSLDAIEAFENDGGFGDVDFGLTMQLVDASANCPYMIATVSATAPTGGDPFTNIAGFAPTAPSIGQGFWSITGNVLFIQPYDPVVVFYGLGTEHFFSRQFLGAEIEPGAQYTYLLGVGFAVNERITLSTRFFGAYVEEIKVDGERRFGTNAEPMSIRMSATISKPCDRLVEPFVEFGLTDDAVSSFIGITWTY